MKENIFKAVIISSLAALSAYFKVLLIPIIMLLIVMCSDYISGIVYAAISKTLSSKIGIQGIVKKAGYLLVVVCGITVDWVIRSAFISAGIEVKSIYLFGLLVIIWLILNELISILENLSKIGVPMPKFLKTIIKRLKVTVENKGTNEIKGE